MRVHARGPGYAVGGVKYFVRLGFDPEQEVSRERYAAIEAAACPRDASRRADPARSGFVGYVDPGEPASPARSAAERAIAQADVLRLIADEPAILAATVSARMEATRPHGSGRRHPA